MPDHSTQPKLRQKYVSTACRECRRRKIRCNGQVPCQRCTRQRIDCIYTDYPGRIVSSSQNSPQPNSDKSIPDQMKSLQNQITTLTATIETFKKDLLHSRPLARGTTRLQLPHLDSRNQPLMMEGAFCGPTTSAFTLGLAKVSLQKQGIVETYEATYNEDEASVSSPVSTDLFTRYDETETNQYPDPLSMIGKIEALRLCYIYEEEMGIQYPILDISELLVRVENLYSMLQKTPLVGNFEQDLRSVGDLEQADVMIVRLVLACALAAEGNGQSELALGLFSGVQDFSNACIWGPPEINSMIILWLIATFYFQMDHERLAWRTIGIVARMSLDAGFHRHETFVNSGSDQSVKLRLFWCVYVLDIRYSFGTGRPFSIKETDIDPLLPKPDDHTAYLKVMVFYSRIAGRVWDYLSIFDRTHEIQKEKMQYLSWQIRKWVQELPDSLRNDNPFEENTREQPRSTQRLRALLYLRAQQLQILVYRPVLQSAPNIMQYPAESEALVTTAKDMIRFIVCLNETSNIYQLQQIAFNWFLLSALATLFLAVAHAPSRFNGSCKDEFYLALELVKRFSTQSYVSRRLWRSIRSLKMLAPKLGLQQDEQPRPTGQQINHGTNSTGDPLMYTPFDNLQNLSIFDSVESTRELMEWFEAMSNVDGHVGDLGLIGLGESGPSTNMLPNFDDGELYNSMRDCF